MTQVFGLKRISEIVPHSGEDLGQALATAALDREALCRAGPGSIEYWAYPVAQMLYLAAEAYEAGAAVCGGHNRADRYHAAAKGYRTKAAELEAQAKAQHDEREGAALMAAFTDGFDHPDAPAAARHSFDRMEAYLIGKLFAREGKTKPQSILKIYSPRPLGRDSERDHLLVDGVKFIVDYPAGKVADAIVTQL